VGGGGGDSSEGTPCEHGAYLDSGRARTFVLVDHMFLTMLSFCFMFTFLLYTPM